MRRSALAAIALGAAGAMVLLATQREADAQRLDPRRPAVFVVGGPGGSSPMQRVDARRTGRAKEALPSGALRLAWRKSLGLSTDQAALAGADGSLAVVTSRGDVAFLDDAGDELARVTLSAGAVGPAAMTADGTIVFVTTAGEAVGIRRGNPRPRFSTHVGGVSKPLAAPLALEDGGSVVATTNDLVALDGSGLVRARVSLPESPSAPLLAWADKVLAITTTGAVFGWSPGREAVRLGSFGGAVDGGAAFTTATTLLAVIEGNHLVELDLVRGARATRSIATQGLYLGPPAVNGTATTLLAMTTSRGYVVTLDASGQEQRSAPIASILPKILPDGGAAPLVAPLHTGPIVDARGAIAWAGTDGHVGVVTAEGAVETVSDLNCPSVSGRSGVAGLTPWGPESFAVTCEGGSVMRVVGPKTQLRKSSPKAAPSGPGRPPPRPEPPPDDDDDDDGPLRRP